MDLQNNSASKVAALDERGVTLETDGKVKKFIPWGEDAEARAAAAAAQSTADTATNKANAAQTAADAADAKAQNATAAAADAQRTADAAQAAAGDAATAAEAAQTAANEAGTKADAAGTKADAAQTAAEAAQTAAEAAAEAAGNAVQKTSLKPQTAGTVLTSENAPYGTTTNPSSGWQLTDFYDHGGLNLYSRGGDYAAYLGWSNNVPELTFSPESRRPTRFDYNSLHIRGGVVDGRDHTGAEVRGDEMSVIVDKDVTNFTLSQRTSVNGTEKTREFGVFSIPLRGDVNNHRIEMRSTQIRSDQSDWARDRHMIIDWGWQTITLRRWKNGVQKYEEKVIDLWGLAQPTPGA